MVRPLLLGVARQEQARMSRRPSESAKYSPRLQRAPGTEPRLSPSRLAPESSPTRIPLRQSAHAPYLRKQRDHKGQKERTERAKSRVGNRESPPRSGPVIRCHTVWNCCSREVVWNDSCFSF